MQAPPCSCRWGPSSASAAVASSRCGCSAPIAALCAELEAIEAREREKLPLVLLFGAGHVGKALASALAPLPLRVRWIDGRADAFPEPAIPGLEVVVSERLLDEVEAAPAGAAFLVLTHSHALDSMVCAAALQRGDFAYLGLIGSRTKRAQFERAFRDLGHCRRSRSTAWSARSAAAGSGTSGRR